MGTPNINTLTDESSCMIDHAPVGPMRNRYRIVRRYMNNKYGCGEPIDTSDCPDHDIERIARIMGKIRIRDANYQHATKISVAGYNGCRQ